MTIPVPSSVRTVRIYSGAQMLATRGISPAVPYRWPPKHPLDTDWWWVDATGWCQDNGDTLLAPPAKTITPNDGTLMCVATAISADGLQAGFLLTGGTSALSYTVTARLIGRTTGASWVGDIVLSMDKVVAVTSPPANMATMNGAALTFGGLTIAPGQSS
jgi:hypothetical protein